MSSTRSARKWNEIVLGLLILLGMVPILWMVVLAFQPGRDIIASGWQFGFTTDNFGALFAPGEPYKAQFANSVAIVVGTVALCLTIGTLAGYSLASTNWPPKVSGLLLGASAIVPIVPPMALVPGLYDALQQYGLLGTIAGLILLNTVFNLPFTVLLMRVYFKNLPGELREAAMMDGASEFTTFRKVMLPLVVPGVASAAIYTAIMTWNDFLFGLTMTSGGTTSPITVGIGGLVQPNNPEWGKMAAAGTLTALPILVVAILARRRIVSGLTQGAVKG